MKTNMDKIYRALAIHAAFTSYCFLDEPHGERIKTFENAIKSYGEGLISPDLIGACLTPQKDEC